MQPLQHDDPAGHPPAGHQPPDAVSAHVQAHGNQVVITIDIADHCKHDRPHPKPDPGQEVVYVLTIDGEKHTTSNPHPTGRDILALVNKTPRSHQLNQQRRVDGKPKVTPVKPDEKVDLTEWGVEMFMTLPLDNTEGSAPATELALRRQFVLAEDDTEYLDGLGLPWETLLVGAQKYVLVHDFPVPDGYTVATTSVAVCLQPAYPRAQLDMVYVLPHLRRTDAQPITMVTPFPLDGQHFEQWSRHRTAANPWRPGFDNLGTHLELARVWFEQEFTKRPRLDQPTLLETHALRA